MKSERYNLNFYAHYQRVQEANGRQKFELPLSASDPGGDFGGGGVPDR